MSTHPMPYFDIEEFTILKEIAKNRRHTIQRAQSKRNGQVLALKIFQPEYNTKFLHEREILWSLYGLEEHANVLRVIGQSKKGQSRVLIFPEYPASTREMVFNKSTYDRSERLKIMEQLAEGLQYLHSIGLRHGDIKLDNILIDDNDRVLYCDFGAAKFLRKQHMIVENLEFTLAYAPRSILYLSSNFPVCFKDDIYSLGIVFKELVTQEASTPDINRARCEFVPTQDRLRYDRDIDTGLVGLDTIIYRMLSIHEDNRPELPDILIALRNAISNSENAKVSVIPRFAMSGRASGMPDGRFMFVSQPGYSIMSTDSSSDTRYNSINSDQSMAESSHSGNSSTTLVPPRRIANLIQYSWCIAKEAHVPNLPGEIAVSEGDTLKILIAKVELYPSNCRAFNLFSRREGMVPIHKICPSGQTMGPDADISTEEFREHWYTRVAWVLYNQTLPHESQVLARQYDVVRILEADWEGTMNGVAFVENVSKEGRGTIRLDMLQRLPND